MVRRSAYQLGSDDLVLSHFSLGRTHPIGDRIRLAAANGFAGIGLFVRSLPPAGGVRRGPGPAARPARRARHAARRDRGDPRVGTRRHRRRPDRRAGGGRLADGRRVRLPLPASIGPADRPVDEAAGAFGGLCDRAADHGLVVGLEFLPFTDIVSVHDARNIVEAADRPNGGICVDIWHHERGARDLAAIAALPAELIKAIQMNDGPRQPADPDYYTDCLTNRMAPGDGEFDVAGFIAALREAGSTVSWSLEVCSAAGWADPAPHVGRIADGMRAALAGAPA